MKLELTARAAAASRAILRAVYLINRSLAKFVVTARILRRQRRIVKIRDDLL